MVRLAIIVAFSLFAVFSAGKPASASGCAAKAAEVAARTGGRVVQVSQVGNECHIRVVIPSESGPPVSKMFVVSL